MEFNTLIETAPCIIKRKLEQLKFLRERPDYHPEPSAFHHIQIVTERLLRMSDPNLVMAGILHDICKFDTVRMNEKTGWPTSPGHDKAAYELIMDSPEVQTWIRQHGAKALTVANICKAHMRFHQLGQMKKTKRESQIASWKEAGIWDALQIFGAADNMMEEFDLISLVKS
jgi:hypothetical protein